MPSPVYRVLSLLCAVAVAVPIGTNLGLLHLCWMLLSGGLLGSRGALFPGLSALGLSEAAVRRAWRALGHGRWTSRRLVQAWAAVLQAEGWWQPHVSGGYHPVAVDVTAFWRPRLQDCPTSHYSAVAGKALPAIPLGLIARIGSVAGQRFGLPLEFVRADPRDPSPSTHRRALIQQAVAVQRADDVLVTDRGFHSRPTAGGRRDGLADAAAEELHRAAGQPASVSGTGAPGHPRGGGAAAGPPAPGTGDSGHATRPGRELARGGAPGAGRAVERAGPAGR